MATAYDLIIKHGKKFRRVYEETVTPNLANYQGGHTERVFVRLEKWNEASGEYEIASSPNFSGVD